MNTGMIGQYLKKISGGCAVAALALSLSACSGMVDRLENVGKAPDFTPIQNHNETAQGKTRSYPIAPATTPEQRQANSLWQAERKGFFKDQRAGAVGDILTVVIEIDDEAEVTNKTTRTRNNSETSGINSLLGFENYLDRFLPDSVVPATALDLASTTNNTGTGETNREEEITTRVAAVIHEVLPNGNLVIFGRQEVRVNYDIRELYVAGVIRPEDIAPDNSIRHDQIAEARIAYGGRGQLMDVQQPRYGQQVLDIIYPF